MSYRVSLDQLKQQLGLPITLPIELDPAPLQPMINLIEGYEKLSIDFERVVYNGLLYGRSTEAKQLRQRLRRLLDRTPLMRGTQTRKRTLRRLSYYENIGKDDNLNQRLQALEATVKELAPNARRCRNANEPRRPESRCRRRNSSS